VNRHLSSRDPGTARMDLELLGKRSILSHTRSAKQEYLAAIFRKKIIFTVKKQILFCKLVSMKRENFHCLEMKTDLCWRNTYWNNRHTQKKISGEIFFNHSEPAFLDNQKNKRFFRAFRKFTPLSVSIYRKNSAGRNIVDPESVRVFAEIVIPGLCETPRHIILIFYLRNYLVENVRIRRDIMYLASTKDDIASFCNFWKDAIIVFWLIENCITPILTFSTSNRR